jgi:WD40 repeat protein
MLTLWEPMTGTQLEEIDSNPQARSDTNGLDWSPDDSVLASAHQDHLVRIWDARSYELLRTLDGHSGWVRGIAFSPGGRLLVTAGERSDVTVWSTESWQPLDQFRCPALPLWSVAWSPDGRYFAIGSGRYDSLTGGQIFLWTVDSD